MGYNTNNDILLDAIRKNTENINVSVDADGLEINTDALEAINTAIKTAVEATDERMDRATAPTSTVLLTGTKAFTGPFYALSALEDSVIDASEGDTNITESDNSGSIQDLSGTLTIPKGMTIYGNFAVVELDSGKMIGYAAAGVTVSVAGS